MNERRDWAPVDWSPMKRLIYLRGNGATGGGGSPLTVSGPTPLLMPGALAKPLKKATFQISPVQSGSGDPSPENVRSIYGSQGGTVYVTGKNLVRTKDAGRTNNDIIYTVNEDGSIKIKGTASGTSWFRTGTTVGYSTYLPAGQYKMTGGKSNNAMLYIVGVYVDGTAISNSTVTGGVYDKGSGLTFTLTMGANITYQIQINNGTEIDDTFYPMIRAASETDDTWTPYRSDTVSVEFPALGKNLFDVAERVNNQTNAAGVASSGYTLTGDTLTISKDLSNYGRVMLSAMKLSAGTYTLSFSLSISGTGRVSYSIRNMSASPKTDIVGSTPTTSATVAMSFTLEQDVDVAISIQPEGSATGTVSITGIQIESGDAAHTYEPYTSTVYFGTIDPVAGTVVATHKCVDLGSLTWAYNAGQLSMVSSSISNAGDGQHILCSNYKVASSLQGSALAANDKCIAFNKASTTATGNFLAGVLVVKDTDYSDAATFKTAMSGVQLVYELADPIPFTVTPQTIIPPAGDAYIWADCGSSAEVTYIGKA